ncbi:hypothetical protein MN086_04400 [Sulfurovum sp. XGS-02]|uniref:M30 family zinc metallopeptidase n=1 Tax=Sulfurovum sp. XGS-02 TaxID=2925411 RepID=UPI0020480353|nr:hypothetical protein [Sulfurovum sp. XGS-02]UPT78391.1 hypothetical protein MN086_04400 [Sulfurovum sp. XGS-02]
MEFNRFSTLLVIVVMTLSGCGGGGGSTTSTDPVVLPTDIDVNVTITGDYQVESLGTANTINANVSVGNVAKDLYLVLSNSATTSASATIAHNAKVTEVPQAKTVLSTDLAEKPRILHHPQYVQNFSTRIGTVLTQDQITMSSYEKIITSIERQEDVVGTGQRFYLSEDTSEYTDATARYVSDLIPTIFGNKKLNIWVSNDSFGVGCPKTKCVTQPMVDALAGYFLSDGLENDIYDWVTNIYGEEWGSNLESYFISQNNEITILLTDIPNPSPPVYDTPDGGIIGFFYPKDNYVKGIYNNGTYDLRGSNERIMFYADAVMFANEDGLSWDINDSWPKEMVSTLSHEFQHMIDFYQKNVLLDVNAETWIKEMLSESTEDIIGTKIGHSVEGRYPIFNANNTLSLTEWNSQLADYAKVNTFGAYLLRNYGGAQVLHDIMHNSFDNEQAVVYAVNQSPNGSGKTFADLLSEWGVAVMLSDHDNLVDTPEYNIGTLFEDVYGSTIYTMNSINLFNYIPQPTLYTTSGTVQPQGNYYYKIGDNVTGDITVSLELNGQTEATLIAK